MTYRHQSRSRSILQRRRDLRQGLRLEHLERRIVFAGISPMAINDVYHAVADQSLEIVASGVLANDTGGEGGDLTALEFRGPEHGSLQLNEDGSFLYTPDAGFAGTDGFVYQVDDGASRSSLAAVTLLVKGSNTAPQATNDAYQVSEDGSLDIGGTNGVLSNDLDAEGNVLVPTLVDSPENGTLEFNTDGGFTYTPHENFHGTDTFTYQISDGVLTSGLAVVEITVEATNDAPLAANDAYETNEDQSLVVEVTGILGNDSDIDSELLTAVLQQDVLHGTLELSADGNFTYTPEENFSGLDSFTYQVSDGQLVSELAVVQIFVAAVNDAPVGEADFFEAVEDEILVVAGPGVLANDTDVDNAAETLTVELVDGAAHGTVELSADGSFTYTPHADYNGADSFSYVVTDGQLVSDAIMVAITVAAVNDAPSAENDHYSTDEDQQLAVNAPGVLGNDTDIDSETLTATLIDGVEHGVLELSPDGSFVYTPDENFNGTDSFTYQASDGELAGELVVVEITVGAVNDAPLGENDMYEASEDAPLTVIATSGVMGNDSDVDGDALTVMLVAPAANGTVELNADGSFTYTPSPDFNGTDAFTYQLSDGQSTSDPIVVEINVAAVNDAPFGENDIYEAREDTPLIVDAASGVLANDSDVDGDALTVTLVDPAASGAVELNADGSFTYTPNADFNGTDAFTYHVSDGEWTSELVTVEISVSANNDAPVATDDFYAIDGGGPQTIPAPGVLENDFDVDGDSLTVAVDTHPEHGTVELKADGSFVYTPAEGYQGPDAFIYSVSDGVETALAVVSIRVRGTSERPTAKNDSHLVGADGELNVGAAEGVLANDSDSNGDPLKADVFRGPKNGTLALNSDGSFQYVPNAGFAGLDSFLYRATDADSQSRLAVVRLRVVASDLIPPESTPPLVDQPAPTAKDDLGNLLAEGESAADAADEFFDSFDSTDLLLPEFSG